MFWKDRWILLPSVEGRLNAMILRTLIQLLQSKDLGLREIFAAFREDERDNRHSAKKREGTTAMRSLDWEQTQMAGLNPTVENILRSKEVKSGNQSEGHELGSVWGQNHYEYPAMPQRSHCIAKKTIRDVHQHQPPTL
jgi:hypothetical protein